MPNSIVLKNDPNYIQGFPDLIVLNMGKWALLEVKRYKDAHEQPNQKHYIERASEMMSYANFIYPENKEEVLNELQQSLGS